MSAAASELVKLTKKDFESNQEVRWCPGCGDYSILAAVQKLLPELGIPKEKHVFVSGIGCSSRFPYYMETYGFHTIHGRAPAVATGLKTANPELTVWVITGDGDALSIGGNHFIHALRRNIDITILLFNNRIYGLTKGQYSPTSELGKITKSTPFGSVDQPLNPLALAIGAGASFVARSIDVDAKFLGETLLKAVEHRGTSVVEIYQNCNVFNDGAHDHVTDRKQRALHQLILEDGAPLIFGQERERGISFEDFTPKVVSGDALGSASVYDTSNRNLASAVASLQYPEFPVPMGVLFKESRPTYEGLVHNQLQVQRSKGGGDLQKLLHSGSTWVVQ